MADIDMSQISPTTSPEKKRQKKDATVPLREPYHVWGDDDEKFLIEWLQDPDNFQNYKCVGQRSQAGVKTNRKTKSAVAMEIAKYLQEKSGKGTRLRSVKNVKDKIAGWFAKYNETSAWLGKTGSGLQDPDKTRDENLQSKSLKDELKKRFKYCFELDLVMFGSPASNPSYVSETGREDEDLDAMLFPGNVDRAKDKCSEADGSDEELPPTGVLAIPNNEPVAAASNKEPILAVPKKLLVAPAPKVLTPRAEKNYKEPICVSDSDDDKKKDKGKEEKRAAPPTFTETLIILEDKKSARAEEDRKQADKKSERLEKLQNRQIELEEKRLDLQQKELDLKLAEAKIRQLELELKLREVNLNRE